MVWSSGLDWATSGVFVPIQGEVKWAPMSRPRFGEKSQTESTSLTPTEHLQSGPNTKGVTLSLAALYLILCPVLKVDNRPLSPSSFDRGTGHLFAAAHHSPTGLISRQSLV